MNNDLRLPPLRFSSLTPPDILAERLRSLIGAEFQLSMFPRTNGSKIRKLIAEAEAIPGFPQATTEDVRYLIALVNKVTGIIEGLVLCPGNRLGDHFSYVSDSNYKCQRSIPMSFFDRYDGLSVYNP